MSGTEASSAADLLVALDDRLSLVGLEVGPRDVHRDPVELAVIAQVLLLELAVVVDRNRLFDVRDREVDDDRIRIRPVPICTPWLAPSHAAKRAAMEIVAASVQAGRAVASLICRDFLFIASSSNVRLHPPFDWRVMLTGIPAAYR